MPVLRITLATFAFLSIIAGNAQRRLIDHQPLKSNKRVSLYATMTDSVGPVYSLYHTSFRNRDSVKIKIDSIDIVPCGGPSSIFFLNDSLGFLTQTGGCYAYYNFLHRTTDGGKTWKDVIHIIGIDIHPHLGNDNFFMFNDQRGIIIWQLENGYILYSESIDGGLTWTEKKAEINNLSGSDILSIEFSSGGQVTLLTGTKNAGGTERKEVTVLQSNDFGKSYRILK